MAKEEPKKLTMEDLGLTPEQVARINKSLADSKVYTSMIGRREDGSLYLEMGESEDTRYQELMDMYVRLGIARGSSKKELLERCRIKSKSIIGDSTGIQEYISKEHNYDKRRLSLYHSFQVGLVKKELEGGLIHPVSVEFRRRHMETRLDLSHFLDPSIGRSTMISIFLHKKLSLLHSGPRIHFLLPQRELYEEFERIGAKKKGDNYIHENPEIVMDKMIELWMREEPNKP